jgi:hypothetical protein
MAEPHSIVVYLHQGRVQRVAFCECCPPIIVEVRTHETAVRPVGSRRSERRPRLPLQLPDGRWRDHEGVYDIAMYEPDLR